MKIAWGAAVVVLAVAGILPLAKLVRAQGEEALVAGERGLPISAAAPSFMPLHLTGAHAGRTACPLCVYGAVPQLQLWVQEAHLEKGLELARRAELLCARDRSAEEGAPQPVAYVMLVPAVPGKLAEATERAVRATGFERVFFATTPAWDHAETSGLYGHSNKDRPDVRVYAIVNRRVYRRWDSPGAASWDEIARAVDESAAYVAPHEVTDAQIAPVWEPGERLEVEFQVVDSRNRPLVGVKVSAMQTDVDGHYNPPGWNRRAPRLAAVAWSDEEGKITFRTIVPGAYPTKTEPAHIHFTATVNDQPKWRTLWFEGDPLLSAERRAWADADAETVIVPLMRGGVVARVRHTFVIPD